MSIIPVSGPSIEPLTVEEARRQIQMGSSAGEPAPSAPAVALATVAAAGNCDNGAHRVGFTFITADGETEIGPLSDVVTVVDKSVNGQIYVTNIATGGSAVTARKAYLVPVAGGAAKYAATIANNTDETLTLNIADASLGAEAPTTNTTANPEVVSWIQSSREICETWTRRRLITQVLDWKIDAFPCGILRLPIGNVTAITSITYVDDAGDTQEFTDFRADLPTGPKCTRGRIEPTYGYTWPQTRDVIAAVTIRMSAGYGPARSSVPEGLKTGMKALIGHWDRSREAVNVGNLTTELPMGVKFCWKPFQTN